MRSNTTDLDVDRLADALAMVGRYATAMPPSWTAGDQIPFTTRELGLLGVILPGCGLILNYDAKQLGLHALPPGVIGRSDALRIETLANLSWPELSRHGQPALRHLDGSSRKAWIGRWARHRQNDLGAVGSLDAIVSSRANGKADDQVATKSSLTTVANQWSSLMSALGNPGALTVTAIPGGAVMTNATSGSLSFNLTNPTGADKKYLLTWGFTAGQQINMAVLVDLCVSAGGINANIATSQTVNTTTLTRYVGGVGIQAIFEISAALGGTGANITTTYTNSAGTGSRSTGAQALTTSGIVGRLTPAFGFTLQSAAGDIGFRSVESVILSAAMGGGTLTLHLFKPLSVVPGIVSNAYVERDSTAQIDGLTELANASLVLGCLGVFVMPNTTSSGIYTQFLRTCAG